MAVAPLTLALSLSDLEAYDPMTPAARGRERRFNCPMPPCAGHSVNASHRSLSLNNDTGKWHCHRCGSAGVLQENRSYQTHRQIAQAKARRAFNLNSTPAPIPTADLNWTRHLIGATALEDSPAEVYLLGRGILTNLATRAGVMYAPRFYGAAAAVFPVRDRDGKTVAVAGRFLNDGREPNKQTAGPKSLGLFVTPGALDADMLAIVEAPIDALSLASVGLSALALVGTSAPDWLASAVAFKRILVALDADVAGDEHSAKLTPDLSQFGAKVERLRPASGKDWNADLQTSGLNGLRRELRDYLPRLACYCFLDTCDTCFHRKLHGGRTWADFTEAERAAALNR